MTPVRIDDELFDSEQERLSHLLLTRGVNAALRYRNCTDAAFERQALRGWLPTIGPMPT